jgi:cation:H+ antiporter
MELLSSGFGFLVCSILIFYHGQKLSFYGNLISIKSGLGKAWVGLILMSSVTSLPELSIGISSVTVVGSADLAVGNVLGSCVFNLAVLSLLDVVTPGLPVLTRVATSNVLAASLGTILLCLVGVGLIVSNEISILNWIGITSLSFLVVYFISMRLLHSYGLKQSAVDELLEEEGSNPMKLRTVLFWYAAHAAMVIVAALVLPYFSEQIAAATGLGESFIGTLLLATSSSLPEIAVSLSAARLGNIEMAVSNLFGSNIFNVMILSIEDVFYTRGNLLRDASASHVVTVFATIAMNAIAIVGLTMRPQKKGFRYVAWDTLLILILYMFTMLFLYLN